MQIAPIDVAEVIRAIFYGVAALCVPVCTVYLMIAASKVKANSNTTTAAVVTVKDDLSKVKDNVVLLEKNTNSLTERIETFARAAGIIEGVRQGRLSGVEAAEQLAEGQRRGIEIERASVAAQAPTTSISSPAPPSPLQGRAGQDEVPVKDNRVATEIGKIASAIEENAAAMDRNAEATQKATEKKT